MEFLWRFYSLLERKQPLAFAPSFSPLGILLGDLLGEEGQLFVGNSTIFFLQFETHSMLTFYYSDGETVVTE